MKRIIRVWALGWLSLVAACDIKHWDDGGCEDDEWSEDDGHSVDPPSGHAHGDAGSSSGSSTAGSASGGSSGGTASGGSAAGGTAGSEAASAGMSSEGGAEPEPPGQPPAQACDSEADCPAGFNCDHDTQLCAPTDQETCAELRSEQSCSNRVDCELIYAGTNCSCGQDCECHGGEPGCICESFEFFACQAAASAQ